MGFPNQRESDHRHDCPRNRQRGGLQSNGGQDVRQWLNNVHTVSLSSPHAAGTKFD